MSRQLRCDKCETVIKTDKNIQFCICGGKLHSMANQQQVDDFINGFRDITRSKN